MTNPYRICAAMALGGVVAFTSCIDDKYDLSDIDTTVQVNVNNLTLPLNLDEITLSNIFDLDDNSCIKVVDGKYVVIKTGNISSGNIKVAAVDINPGNVAARRVEILNVSADDPGIPAGFEPDDHIYLIESAPSSFSYEKNDVDASIRSIDRVAVDWTISVNIAVDDPSHNLQSLSFKDITVKLPQGVSTDSHTINGNGLVEIPDFKLTAGQTSHTVDIHVNAIDLDKTAPGEFTFTPGAEGQPGKIEFHSQAGVSGGYVAGKLNAGALAPGSVFLVSQPKLGILSIKKFTGILQYEIDSFNAPDIDLNDLPDVLSQQGTDIRFKNPQIYVSLNNPMAGYNLEGASGLSIDALRNGQVTGTYPLDAGEQIIRNADKGIAGPYLICLSPVKPEKYYTGFDGAEHVGYAALSNVVSGDGLPQSLDIDFINPRIMAKQVTDFVLNADMGKVEGSYTFFSPLELGVNSTIVYSDTENGWSDETVEKMTITSMTVKASLTNDLPFDLVISGYPVDRNGNQCVDPTNGQPVTIEGATVTGGTTADITLTTTGKVTDLDGIHFDAHAVVTDANQVLSPDTKLKFTNIKVTVSGYYLDEDKD